jgi:hypothetical protein
MNGERFKSSRVRLRREAAALPKLVLPVLAMTGTQPLLYEPVPAAEDAPANSLWRPSDSLWRIGEGPNGTADSWLRYDRMPVQQISKSSAIERVAYNAAARRLSIWFKGGRRYVYSDVPEDVYRELCAASSAGKFVCERVLGKFTRTEPKPRHFGD